MTTGTSLEGSGGSRAAKFRQAAFVYLFVAILYESSVWVLHGAGALPAGRGPVAAWLVAGALVAAVVFWALYFRRSVWVARVVMVLGAFRLPALIRGAFVETGGGTLEPSFYQTALVVVLINLWMLARAGWDL
ncbi:MAG: hypothetical protein R3195_17130 [Gemmatimonadota bacterium]|nr:hypothetical protein [Gemmatimonadota bacterium]